MNNKCICRESTLRPTTNRLIQNKHASLPLRTKTSSGIRIRIMPFAMIQIRVTARWRIRHSRCTRPMLRWCTRRAAARWKIHFPFRFPFPQLPVLRRRHGFPVPLINKKKLAWALKTFKDWKKVFLFFCTQFQNSRISLRSLHSIKKIPGLNYQQIPKFYAVFRYLGQENNCWKLLLFSWLLHSGSQSWEIQTPFPLASFSLWFLEHIILSITFWN